MASPSRPPSEGCSACTFQSIDNRWRLKLLKLSNLNVNQKWLLPSLTKGRSACSFLSNYIGGGIKLLNLLSFKVNQEIRKFLPSPLCQRCTACLQFPSKLLTIQWRSQTLKFRSESKLAETPLIDRRIKEGFSPPVKCAQLAFSSKLLTISGKSQRKYQLNHQHRPHRPRNHRSCTEGRKGGKDTWSAGCAGAGELFGFHLSRRRTVGGEGGREECH